MSQINQHEFYILHNSCDAEILQVINTAQNLFLLPKEKFMERKYEKLWYNFLRIFNYGNISYNFKFKFKKWSYVQRICQKLKIDIVHSPYNPPYTLTPVVWTLHDCQELIFPDYFPPDERLRRAWARLESFMTSPHVIVSYDHIKKDIIKYFSINENDIQVLPINMSNSWVLNQPPREARSVENLDLPLKYLFYPANMWEHKNHIAILKAMTRLIREGFKDIHVVFSGNKTGFYSQIEEFVTKNHLQSNVTFTGMITQDELQLVYKRALAVVIPTKYEAGSFPLMESILMEVPVICSNVTSLPDTIQNDRYLFDPDDYTRLAGLIYELWCNEDFRNENILHLKAIRSDFTKMDTKTLLIEIYKKIIIDARSQVTKGKR